MSIGIGEKSKDLVNRDLPGVLPQVPAQPPSNVLQERDEPLRAAYVELVMASRFRLARPPQPCSLTSTHLDATS